ncbi:uncharacterized protein LOC133160653 isoform X2 [Syngnathus typhle]|uniref:uncharacterized protein LOC133160653 isoform X2 n=1 Tax=Syngnathus typhle TaxID=161592 RepID=UPI002A6A1A46|nr:uncharacterized protein LOC133160653 isoform X2 [Syngnathus typhle]
MKKAKPSTQPGLAFPHSLDLGCEARKTLWLGSGDMSPPNADARLISALGTVQILVGALNIGLGPGRTSSGPADLSALGAAYWLGAVFVVTGIMSLLSGRLPPPGLKCFAALLNLACAIFALAALVLYAADAENASVLWMCQPRLAGRQRRLHADCATVALLAQRLLTAADATLTALAVVQLFVNLKCAAEVVKAPVVGREMTSGRQRRNSRMSVTAMGDKNVAVVTVASNQTSALGSIQSCGCCRPCRVLKGEAKAVLGTIQILVGVINMGLGVGRTRIRPGDLASLGAAYWIGAVFVTAGVLSLLSGQCPSCCFASLTVTVNVLCAVLSVVAVVLYALDLAPLSVGLFCGSGSWHDGGCEEVALYAIRLTRGLDITLLILAVLVLCVSISMSVLAVAAEPPTPQKRALKQYTRKYIELTTQPPNCFGSLCYVEEKNLSN